jgi:hypothetical protein
LAQLEQLRFRHTVPEARALQSAVVTQLPGWQRWSTSQTLPLPQSLLTLHPEQKLLTHNWPATGQSAANKQFPDLQRPQSQTSPLAPQSALAAQGVQLLALQVQPALVPVQSAAVRQSPLTQRLWGLHSRPVPHDATVLQGAH